MILAAAVVAFFLSSCQKEISTETGFTASPGNTNSPSIWGDSTALLKYIDLDTSATVGHDTLDLGKYTYDANKRIARTDYIEYDNMTAPQRDFRTDIFFTGADSLPYKTTEAEIDLPSGTIGFTLTNLYYYSGTKLDSVRRTAGGSSWTLRYSYAGNRITEMETGFPDHTTDFTRSNGNTIVQADTMDLTYDRFAFTYDTHPNPFANHFQPYVDRWGLYYHLETSSEEMVYEKNNPTDINESGNGSIYHFKYSYQYKSNGYPAIAHITDQDDPGIFLKEYLCIRICREGKWANVQICSGRNCLSDRVSL